MSWSRSSVLRCEQGHRWDITAAGRLPERDGRLICPRCARILIAVVPAKPEDVEARVYPRLLRRTLLLCLLAVPLIVLVFWLGMSRWRIVAIAAAPNGSSFAVSRYSAGDNEVYLVNPATGQRTDITRGKRMSGPLAFTGEGRTLAVAVSEPESQPRPGERGLRFVGVIQLWDGEPWKQRLLLRGHRAPITTLAFTSDGRSLFSADTDRVIKRWDVVSGREQASHTSDLPFRRMAVSPDGRWAALVNTTETVALVDTSAWRLTPRQGLLYTSGSSPPAAVAFSPDNQILAVAGIFDRQVTYWDLAVAAAPSVNIPVAADWLTCLAFSPDGRTLAVGCGSFAGHGEVTLFDLPSGRQRAAWPVRSNTVTSVAFSANGATIIAGSCFPLSVLSRPRHGEVYRWDVQSGRPLPPEG